MAELDSSIILKAQYPQLPDPMQLTQGAMAIRNLGTQGKINDLNLQQAQQSQADQQTLQQLYQQNLNPDGTVNHQGIVQGLAASGHGDKIPLYLQSLAEQQKAQTGASAAEFDLAKKRADYGAQGSAAFLQDPDFSDQALASNPQAAIDKLAAFTAQGVQQGLLSPDDGAKFMKGLPPPQQLRAFLMQRGMAALDTAKQIEARKAMAPIYNEQNRGGTINEGTVDPLTGKRTAGADVAVTMAPDQKERLAALKAKGFTDDEGNLLSALFDRGFAMPSGLRGQAQQKATLAATLRRFPDLSVDELADRIARHEIEFKADTKAAQIAGGIAGKIRYAEEEINRIAPLVLEASAQVPRDKFVPWNTLQNYTRAQLSDPALKAFSSYMNTLSNAYDMLAARGGTDMEKRAHNRAMFDTADSPEALQAALDAVVKEANISQEAGAASMVAPSRISSGAINSPRAGSPGGARPPLGVFGKPGP